MCRCAIPARQSSHICKPLRDATAREPAAAVLPELVAAVRISGYKLHTESMCSESTEEVSCCGDAILTKDPKLMPLSTQLL